MRVRFALSHLLLSSLIFGGVTVLLFVVWFPAGYRELSGVVTLLLWMLAVDVVLVLLNIVTGKQIGRAHV